LLALHGWHLATMLRGEMAVQTALLISLRELAGTTLMLAPAWLPSVVPPKYLSRWNTVLCGAVSLAIAVSFAAVVVLRRETFLVAVVAIYGIAGLLHLARRSPSTSRSAVAPKNGT
jgi:hypothetical protein